MKSLLIGALLQLLAASLLLPAPAVLAATTIVDYVSNTPVPDNNPTGFADTRTILGSSITSITSVEVRLQLTGGWNGDFYAHLSHDSGFSVLLNRPGKTTLDPIGSGSSGFDITLSDDAITDVHTGIPGSGFVTGIFQPDARSVDPDLVTDLDPRTAWLSSFQNLNANGSWTLFVVDNAAGDQATLAGWGLTILGVPEPSRALLLLAGLTALLLQRRRRLVA